MDMTPERIKEIRRNAELSVTQLAAVLNLDNPDLNGADRVREFERGKRVPSGPIVRLLELIEAYELPDRYFPDRDWLDPLY